MKRKKMAKWLMAEGITRNEADTFARVYRKLSSQKKEYLFPLMTNRIVPPVVQRIRHKVQKLRETYRWEPYEYSIVGAEKAEEYAKRRMCENLVKHLMESGFLKVQARGGDIGYVEITMSLLVATELEGGYELVEM